ncbi:hypothetical protein C0J52_05916 [Blattella germanica]|nr:hypothetical protein C0J52_05916 [Blattella germanica]
MIRYLEAQKNSKLMALESARKKNPPSVREIEFKLGEIERKLMQMRKSKEKNLTLDPRELARMERDAQTRILLGADIVATTLSSCFTNQMESIYHQNRELLNSGEAELVTQLTVGILEKLGSKHLTIGIITPYHKQRTTIQSYLESQCQGTVNVEVNTIDSFQGQERDIIVMSCVRTGGVGFLADTQRLNVALTRARYSLLLCGNFTSLRVGSDNMWRALLENASQRNVLKHVTANIAKNKEELMKLVLREK